VQQGMGERGGCSMGALPAPGPRQWHRNQPLRVPEVWDAILAFCKTAYSGRLTCLSCLSTS